MKITYAIKRKPKFVTKHEVGKVYIVHGYGPLMLVKTPTGEYIYVVLSDGRSSAPLRSLEEIDKRNDTDILIDCELVIKGE